MPDPICVGDSILVEVRGVRARRIEPDGREVLGEPTAYVVVAFHNGYSRQWTFPATPKGCADALTEGLRLFRVCVEASEVGRLWVDL